MTVIRLYCVGTDGRRRIVRQEHDTPVGRSQIERAAFAEMSRSTVAYCVTERDDTTNEKRAIPRGNGRYR